MQCLSDSLAAECGNVIFWIKFRVTWCVFFRFSLSLFLFFSFTGYNYISTSYIFHLIRYIPYPHDSNVKIHSYKIHTLHMTLRRRPYLWSVARNDPFCLISRVLPLLWFPDHLKVQRILFLQVHGEANIIRRIRIIAFPSYRVVNPLCRVCECDLISSAV